MKETVHEKKPGILKRMLSSLLQALDDLFFPEQLRCLGCLQALNEQERDGLCPACVQALKALSAREEEFDKDRAQNKEALVPGVDYVCAAFPYEGVARELILRLKFDSVRAAAIPLAHAMSMLPGGEEELIVPIPTTKKRLRSRGFNQAEVLARLIGKETGMPVANALTRSADRAEQSTLSAQERTKNLIGTLRADKRVRGKRILVVDDVYTTGSTVREAARALLEAGAVGVGVFTAARSVPLGQRDTGDPFQIPISDKIHGKS